MKDIAKSAGEWVNIKETVYAALSHIIAALCGFASAKAGVGGMVAPFGIAAAAGAPGVYTPAVVIGAAAGYFIPVNGFGSFKYIAAITAVAMIKYMLESFKKISNNPVIASLIVFPVTMIISITASLGTVYSVLLGFCEAALASFGTYFISVAFRAIANPAKELDTYSLTSLIITVNILFMGFMDIQISDISLGRIAGGCFVLAAARYGQAQTGAVCGISVAVSVALHDLPSAPSALAFCASGLMSGVFSKAGKAACAFSYLLTFILSSILYKNGDLSIIMVVETIFSTAIFLVLPRTFCRKLGRVLSPPAAQNAPNGLRSALVLRLKFASSALKDVSNTVEQVSRQLTKINSPGIEETVEKIANDVCRGCNFCTRCWENSSEDAKKAVLGIARAASGKEEINEIAGEFLHRCLRPEKLSDSVLSRYTEYLAGISSENRLEDVRSVVSDQFCGISEMLSELANEFSEDQQYDTAAAEKISAAFKDIGVFPSDCGCKIDKYGRMTVEVHVTDKEETVFNRRLILNQAETVCGRDFESPVINETQKDVMITLAEKALLTADTGVAQITNGKISICGDAYSCFNDGKGRLIMVLSDGMGSGGRAAVDSAMASGLMSRLLRAGFGYDCSLKILNSSMLFKSTDESLATVDIVCIDLFTGRADLLKAGAAPTLIRRNGRTGKAQSTSLPAGILRDISFDKATVKLTKGDITLMMSDGVISEGTEWICAELESWRDGSARSLAEKIAESAYRRRTDGHEDDITVIAAILSESV